MTLTGMEFNSWLRNCIRDGRRDGLSTSDILEQFLLLTGVLIIEEKHERIQEQARCCGVVFLP